MSSAVGQDYMHVQVVQDLICPWCRIGKVNLDKAVDTYALETGEDVTVEWVPFLLDPVEKGSKEPFFERLSKRKEMSEEDIKGMFANVEQAGENVGLKFNFDRIGVAVDTIPGHEMLALIPGEYQSKVLDGLHRAYFEEGKDIGEPDVLETIARDAGVPETEMTRIREAWATNTVRFEVQNLVKQVQQAGVSGVPFFIFDGVLAANGAQPPEVLVDAMKQAKTMPAEAAAQ